MSIFLETHGDYDVFKLNGEVKVNLIPEISPRLAKYIQGNPEKNLILDLSMVDFIDSSTIRMLINLHKRLEPQQKKLCLLSPSSAVSKIIQDVKLDSVFSIVSSTSEIEKETTRSFFQMYSRYTTNDNDLLKLNCTCAVCGSSDVQGYLIDENAYDWSWENESLFPSSTIKGTQTEFDVLCMTPIVCMNCYMCSLSVTQFNTVGTDALPAVSSQLSEMAKQLLSKGAKSRKKIMEDCIVVSDKFFLYPRKKLTTYFCLRLAEACARSMTTLKLPSIPFQIGYLNYLTVQYAKLEEKEELIGNIRTWMSQVISEKQLYKPTELSKAFFVLCAAAISLDKPKEAIKLFEDFTAFAHSISADVNKTSTSINDPAFWFAQGQRICEKLS